MRKLLGYRSTRDYYLGGVFGGLAERCGIDPFFLRGAAIALVFAADPIDGWPAFFSILYGLAWILIPGEQGTSLLGQLRTSEGRRGILTVAVVTVAVAIVVSRRDLAIGGIFAVIAWMLLTSEHERLDEPATLTATEDTDPGVPDRGTETPTEAVDDRSVLPPPNGPMLPPPLQDMAAKWGRTRRGGQGLSSLTNTMTRPTRRTRREPALWPLTLGLLVGFTVIFAAADSMTDPGLSPAYFFTGALCIIGGVLMLSAWRGRALWTIVLAVPLIPGWIAFSVADIGRYPGDGRAEHFISGQPNGPIQSGYGLMDVVVQKSALSTETPLRLELQSTAGSQWIAVPAEADIELRSHVGLGSTTVESHWRDSEPHVDRYLRRFYEATEPRCLRSDVPVRTDDAVDMLNDQGLRTTAEILSASGFLTYLHDQLYDGVNDDYFDSGDGELTAGTTDSDRDTFLAYKAAEELTRQAHAQGIVLPDVIEAEWDGHIPRATTWLVYYDLEDPTKLCSTRDDQAPLVIIDTTMGLGEIHVYRP